MEQKLNSPKSPMAIYNWLKFIGLSSFTLKNNKLYPASFPDKLYPVTLAFAYLLLVSTRFFMGVEMEQSNESSPFTRNNVLFYYVLNCSITFVTFITFFLMSNEAISIVNKLCVMGNDFKRFGIDEDLEKFSKNIFVIALIANIGIGAMYLVTIFLGPFQPIHVSIANIINGCIRLNMLLIFTQVLLFIGKRFDLLNTRFHTAFQLADNAKSSEKSATQGKRESESKNDNETDENRENIMRKVEKSHLELCELVDRVKRLFAVPVSLYSISFLLELVKSCHWMFFTIRNPHNDDNARYIIFCPIIRTGIVIVELFVIAHATAAICKKGNEIKTVLFRVWHKFSPTELTDEFFMFALRLFHKPVTVSAAHDLFDLGYSYLYKMFCATVGYLIIVIQLETSRGNLSRT